MAAIRSIIFLLVQLVTVIPWAFVCLACAPLPLHVRYRVTVQWPRAMTWAGRWICGMRWQVIGAENLPDGPAVLLPKHQSTWETFFLIWAMPRDLCFVFKRELLYVPFFGWGMALLKMIHIDRTQGRNAFDSVVRQGAEQLASGRWVIIFPEGTRFPAGVTGQVQVRRSPAGDPHRQPGRADRDQRRTALAKGKINQTTWVDNRFHRKTDRKRRKDAGAADD